VELPPKPAPQKAISAQELLKQVYADGIDPMEQL
jgi:hypothetical protein